MSATCPACGVAVVPGYVKCPKCGAALPSTRAAAAGPGGTAVASASGGPPIVAIAVGVAVAVGIVLFFALKKGGSDATPETPQETATEQELQPTATQDIDPATALDNGSKGSAVVQDPTFAVHLLDKALKKERLWGTVQTFGTRVDVRSGACADPGMKPLIDANAGALREGGLTRLRCLEQSGAVVFERDL